MARPDLANPLVELHLAYGQVPDSFAIDADEARELVVNLRGAFAELGESLVSIAPPIAEAAATMVEQAVAVGTAIDGEFPTWHDSKMVAEKAYLQAVLERHSDNMAACARVAQVDYRYWHTLLHKHGLHR